MINRSPARRIRETLNLTLWLNDSRHRDSGTPSASYKSNDHVAYRHRKPGNFECPYCQAASSTLRELLTDYDGDVRLVYKHNPLSFHPSAEPAARYFEAIALQDEAQAWQFHDQVFDLQHRLAEGTDTLEVIAGSLDIDQQRLMEDLYGEIVEQRLKSDRMEAERFGFDGTPAFLVNGISIIGNRPKDDFERIIAWFL